MVVLKFHNQSHCESNKAASGFGWSGTRQVRATMRMSAAVWRLYVSGGFASRVAPPLADERPRRKTRARPGGSSTAQPPKG